MKYGSDTYSDVCERTHGSFPSLFNHQGAYHLKLESLGALAATSDKELMVRLRHMVETWGHAGMHLTGGKCTKDATPPPPFPTNLASKQSCRDCPRSEVSAHMFSHMVRSLSQAANVPPATVSDHCICTDVTDGSGRTTIQLFRSPIICS